MNVNFDGMRRNATANMNELGNVIKEEILSKDSYDISDEIKEKIIEAFNNAAQSVDIMNCLYGDTEEDDMHDLSDVLSIDLLELPSCSDNEDDE